MRSDAADLFYEGVTLRGAYTDLVHHVCVAGTDPDKVDLAVVRSGLDAFGVRRFAAMLYAHKSVDTIEAGRSLALEVERRLMSGERPRPLKALLRPEEREAIERAFGRVAANEEAGMARDSLLVRVRARVARWLVADEATSLRMDEAEREQRVREGKQP